MTIKNIPNILSTVRLLLVPVFVALFVSGYIPAAIAVFIFAGATDVLDGYIARKYNCTSVLGKILDPLADKAMQMSAFVCLWLADYIPLWMPIVYLIKELATVIGAFFIFKKTNFVVKSNVFGKLATVFVFSAVFVISLFSEFLGAFWVNTICLAVALYFVFSCGVYCGEDLIKLLKGIGKNKK